MKTDRVCTKLLDSRTVSGSNIPKPSKVVTLRGGRYQVARARIVEYRGVGHSGATSGPGFYAEYTL